jgi:hypothetical protein
MRIAPMGVRFPDGTPLAAPLDMAQLAVSAGRGAAGELRMQASRLRPLLDRPPTFGIDLAPHRPVDMTNPLEAGWTVVVSARDPRGQRLLDLIAPLAAHRGMRTAPLEFPGGDQRLQAEWIGERYLSAAASSRPKYVLLLGGPTVLPFSLQVELAASFAIVGRLDFDTDDDLAAYVEKIIRLDRAAEAVPGPESVVLAVDDGLPDVTWFSLRYLARPIADQIDAAPPFRTRRLFGEQATKAAFRDALTEGRPALVYTASHGEFADPSLGPSTQRRVNGSIRFGRSAPVLDASFGVDDVPGDDVDFCHGGVFVQFACWGYGTPAESSFDHWGLPESRVHAAEPFVAALPKRLLAHPRGPVAYAGHIDTAWLYGFTDPARPEPAVGERYHSRLEAFRTIVDRSLLRRWPAGHSLEDLHARTAWLSTRLATYLDTLKARNVDLAAMPPGQLDTLADNFVRRNDSMNFMLLGDPAARVRVGV